MLKKNNKNSDRMVKAKKQKKSTRHKNVKKRLKGVGE